MCKSPLQVKQERSDGWCTVPVPCGKCNDCIYSKIVSWQFRLQCEVLHSDFPPLFVTLTYHPDYVKRGLEYDPKNGRAYVKYILEPRDLTLYWKRLRFNWDKFFNPRGTKKADRVSVPKITYWAVGEYGSKRKRPHYHAILFGIDDLRIIQDSWGLGIVDIRIIDDAPVAVGYCLKYLFKRDTYYPAGFKPFFRASKGIGLCYVTPEVIAYHKRDFDNAFVSLLDGIQLSIPKYLKAHIFTEQERFLLAEHLHRRIETIKSDRVSLLMQNSGRSEEEILYDLFVEPQKLLPSFHNQVF